MAGVRLPADVELEDRLAFGLTGRQLALLAGSAACAYAAERLAAGLLPLPFALATGVAVAALGLALAFAGREGLSGEALALAALRHLLGPRRLLLAPEGLAPPLPGAEGLRAAPLEPPVARIRRSGLVELADGSHCRLLAVRGSSFLLRSEEEQAAYVAAFGRFLNGLVEPVQIQVAREHASLEPQAGALEQAADGLPAPLAAAAAEHAAFLRSLGGGEGSLWRRRILLVLRSGERDAAVAEAALARSAAQAAELLRGAEVVLSPLGGEQVSALLARALDPPAGPPGSLREGVVEGARLAQP
jgi:hypothetical protein